MRKGGEEMVEPFVEHFEGFDEGGIAFLILRQQRIDTASVRVKLLLQTGDKIFKVDFKVQKGETVHRYPRKNNNFLIL